METAFSIFMFFLFICLALGFRNTNKNGKYEKKQTTKMGKKL